MKFTAGVSWFTQLSAAMGEDPGRVFQQCITSLGQQAILKPPYNHASRTEVGLQQHWCDNSARLRAACDRPWDMSFCSDALANSQAASCV